MQESPHETTETGLFDDHLSYTAASSGQRFLNWLIDNILLRVVVTFLTGEMFVKFLYNMAPEYTIRVFTEEGVQYYLISYLFAIIHYVFYYTICEAALKGRTIGKFITGTRAIRDDGQELTFKDALLRSLSRMVPFEIFSGLGNKPWHDSWTKTTVVKAR